MPRLLFVFALFCLLGACANTPETPPADPPRAGSPSVSAPPVDPPPTDSVPVPTSPVADPPAAEAADTTADAETRAAFERIMTEARAERWHEQPFGDLVQTVASTLLGARYQDGLLDVAENEALVVNLAAFDCVLYVENVLALAQAVARQDYTWEAYTGHLEGLRYREGALEGYCSRLHYFSDWIHDNARRGHVRDVTQEIGGAPFEQTLDFMSTHRDAYPRLAADSVYQCIVGVEAALRERTLYYVPEERIRTVYPLLQPGDVVATATDIAGLDVTHTGFVYRTAEGGTGFIHASITGEVKVSDDLAGYIEDNERQIGILVARPLPPSEAPVDGGP